ncbi:MAG: hypothetical protein K2Q18_09300 [Bdellovibrionales bacterium]|nr:hypothetical protein [Bdellovibrionales bacterium]
MDRRTIQNSLRLKKISPNISIQSCIHTRNVFSIVDLSPEEESYKKLRKHVDLCKICSKELQNFELQIAAARIYIPKPQIDTDTKEMYEREVSELFRFFDLNEKELLKKKIKNKIKSIDHFGGSFMKHLGSKQMLTTYAFGAVIFIVLRQFFS